MFKNYKNWLKTAVAAALLGWTPQMFAQAVIFPQEKQAGTAQALQEGEVFTLQNDLLKASFKKVDGKLTFTGCEALDLLPNDVLFKVQLGNGSKTVTSTQMTLGSVEVKDLAVEMDKAKGSLRIPGKAIEATYKYQNLEFVWRAVLRDGSHYLRTELNIKANANTDMYAVVPMMYAVDNVGNEKAPTVVGNTRGAIIMSDKIFAGLETPTAFNSIESSAGGADLAEFKANSWGPQSFKWAPGKDLPEGVAKNGLKAEDIVAARGYIKFYEAGDNQITFTYKSGANRLNIMGVDAVDMAGNVVAKDYHHGFAGTPNNKNVFTLKLDQADCYMVRFFVDKKTEPITSSGVISYSKKIAPAEVVFDATETKASTAKQSIRAISGDQLGENETVKGTWTPDEWKPFPKDEVFPNRINELGLDEAHSRIMDKEINLTAAGTLTVEFQYREGNNQLNLAALSLLNSKGQEITSDLHKGSTGNKNHKNVYSVTVANPGKYIVRLFAENKTNPIDCKGDINMSLQVKEIIHLPAPKSTNIQGLWKRDVTLEKGKSWDVSAVVGLIAPGQQRRSVLCYVERERAVPWRAFPIYVSWYELNINRNNDRNYDGNMHDYQCSDIVRQWQKNLYEPYGAGIKAFVWDDGWDEYGTWTFNKNFPNGFDEPDKLAKQMESGIGAWLGPVGGYGQSGNYRREYWNDKGGMRLSNPRYYKVFREACDNLMNQQGYDFRFFKFDGISDLFSATGPKDSPTGDEDAEAIIHAEKDMRTLKDDIFFNTTVGTWASPFWFSVTDAVWRQEKDYGTMGDNKSDRENWITYRDRLVYQNFVQNSPMCPINCLMTHGFILSRFGGVSSDMDYDAIVREMHCAFACGSGMVELYNDYQLMNTIKDKNGKAGALWEELAKCIEWQEKNADVLPDTHWVGGNPWNGETNKAEVYGWAAWNGKNAVLTLRNGANYTQKYTTTLRQALDIPEYVKGSIVLNKGFEQADLKGLAHGQEIDIDEVLTLTLPGSSVYVFDNTQPKVVENYVVNDLKQINNRTAYTLQAENKQLLLVDPADKVYVHAAEQVPTNAANEQFALISNPAAPAQHYFLYAMGAKKFVYLEGDKLALGVEPMDMVCVAPVAQENNTQFVLKFADDKVVAFSKEAHNGIGLGSNADGPENKMTLTAVNHKAGLSSARAKVEDLYKYEKLDRKAWTVTASSHCGMKAENMIDGNINTYWQANYENKGEGEMTMPYTLLFDLGSVQKFCSFGYYARLDQEVGVCKSYALDVSKDNKTWKTVKSGELKMDDRKFIWGEFGKTVEAQYVRLTIASNQAADHLAAVAEFYLGYDGSEVTAEMHSLPLFSTEESPIWYPVYFKRGGAYLEDMGAEQKMKTAAQRDVDAQQWQFMGNEYGFIMKSKTGHYVCFKDDRFQTTAEKSNANELEFMQHAGVYLEMKVKGDSKCMNQFGGGGVGRELGAWNAGDGGNAFQVMEITVPEPELPKFSDEKQEIWYTLQFKNGKKVIEDQGEGKSVRLADANNGENQVWKLVGNRNKFQIVNAQGHYLVVSEEAEEEVGPEAGANPHPVRAMTASYTPGFKLVKSENMSFFPGWEIQSNDGAFKGKSFNQHAGTNVGRTIGFWNAGDNNNPIDFVGVATGIQDLIQEGDTIKAVYNLAGVRVNTENLSKGVYIVNGKKVIVK